MSIKNKESVNDFRFMASNDDYSKSDIVIVGAPVDFSCSFRPGTRFGPQKIREISEGIEEYSLYQDYSLEDCNFHDCGDLSVVYGDIQASHKIIYEAVNEIKDDNKMPFLVGGEHSVSFPAIKSVSEHTKEQLVIIHFDAHADLRKDYMGFSNSHASVIRNVYEHGYSKDIYQFGIRSGTKEEFEYAEKYTNMFPFKVYEPLSKIINEIGNRPVYITLDIDVVDPAYANGTGTPEPCGITSSELIDSIVLMKNLNIVGFDIVELSPVYDNSDRTALLCAKALREMIIMVCRKINNK